MLRLLPRLRMWARVHGGFLQTHGGDFLDKMGAKTRKKKIKSLVTFKQSYVE
jgi:hypothetical protein